MYIITSTCIMIMRNFIQSEIVTENARQMMLMIHECMNRERIIKFDICVHRVSKNCAKLFSSELRNFPPILIIFGRKMAKRLELCEVHSLSTSPNLCHHTTVLNADVRNCYTTLKVLICSKLSNDLISTCLLYTSPSPRD